MSCMFIFGLQVDFIVCSDKCIQEADAYFLDTLSCRVAINTDESEHEVGIAMPVVQDTATLLFQAIQHDNRTQVQSLLLQGIDPASCYRNGLSYFGCAVDCNNPVMIQVFLDCGAKDESNLLLSRAIKFYKNFSVQKLLDHSSIPCVFYGNHERSYTLIALAAQCSNNAAMELLIRHYQRLNVNNCTGPGGLKSLRPLVDIHYAHGDTSLIYLTKKQDDSKTECEINDCRRLLLACGANPDEVNDQGKSARSLDPINIRHMEYVALTENLQDPFSCTIS